MAQAPDADVAIAEVALEQLLRHRARLLVELVPDVARAEVEAQLTALTQDAVRLVGLGLEHRSFSARLVEELPDAAFVLVEDHVVYANRVACAALGDPFGERVRAVPALHLVEPADRELVRARMAAVVAGEPAEARDIRLRTFTGTTEVFELVSLRIDFEGRPAILSVGRVVGERREAQARRLRAERDETLSAVVAGLAHEVNNPLTYVITNLGFAQRELRAQPATAGMEDILEALAEAKEGAERVRLLVRDLRLFARSEPQPAERIDVARVVRSTVALAASDLRARARLVLDVREVPAVLGSESQLGQVLLNLLVNAAQAMSGRSADTDEVRVSCGVEDGAVVIRVADTGAGIAPENLDRIWDPFFTTKGRGGGTGLGLAISQRIVSELGGELRVASELGRGSTFTIRLRPEA